MQLAVLPVVSCCQFVSLIMLTLGEFALSVLVYLDCFAVGAATAVTANCLGSIQINEFTDEESLLERHNHRHHSTIIINIVILDDS